MLIERYNNKILRCRVTKYNKEEGVIDYLIGFSTDVYLIHSLIVQIESRLTTKVDYISYNVIYFKISEMIDELFNVILKIASNYKLIWF